MIRAFRESPVTLTLCGAWVVIFALMAYLQGGLQNGSILPQTARGFGYLTVRDVMAGQAWRTLTATFIHFNLLHLGLNLFGLFQLGRVLESWYGSGPFLAVYVIIGIVGNAVAVGLKFPLARVFPGVAAFRDLPSGGGSSVLCGLIALLAVVGWRSRTRLGNVIKAEMIGILGFTALLGVLIPIVDNFGHLGGAIAGAVIGFFHKVLLEAYERPRACRLAGWAAVVVLLATGGLQLWISPPRVVRDVAARPRDANDLRREVGKGLATVQTFGTLLLVHGQIAARHPGFQGNLAIPLDPSLPGPNAARLRAALDQTLATLDLLTADSPAIRNAPCYARIVALSRKALETPPSPGEKAELFRCVNELLKQPGRDLNQNLLQLRQLQAPQAPPAS